MHCAEAGHGNNTHEWLLFRWVFFTKYLYFLYTVCPFQYIMKKIY